MSFSTLTALSPEIIVWEDISQCPETWAEQSELEDWLSDVADAHVEQIGYIVFETEKLIVVADSFIESMGLFGNCTKIPKSCIISRTKITI